MPYNREALFNLPAEEKYELVLDLWENIENESLPVTEEEIEFAKERLKLHKEKPLEGLGCKTNIQLINKSVYLPFTKAQNHGQAKKGIQIITGRDR